jgi:succinoglycan biosynthesis transport protein ExoP
VTDKFAGTTYRPGNVGNEWLRSAVGAVRNRWIILLVCALFGGFLGAVLTSMQSPSYESSAVIYQTPHFGDTDGTSRQRTEAYTKLLSSDFLIETALANTGLEMSNSDVREMTTASANVGSAILTVTVRAEDADTSAKLANALAQALPGAVAVLDGSTPAQPAPDQSETLVPDPVRFSPAVTDDAEGGPQYVRNTALGVIAGLLVGLLYAYLRNQMSRKVQDVAALGKFLSGPVLAGIPADTALETGVVDFSRESPAAEAFRRLRTVIADHEPGRGECRTIIVSSAVTGDGKTAGLIDYLLNGDDIDRYITASWHPKLSFIAAGRTASGKSELLGSTRMRNGLADLAARANYVIVDTAPMTDRSDALVLGRWADGVLLVARSDHTRYAELGAVIERLSLAELRVWGVVLNDSPRPLARSARKRSKRLSAAKLLTRDSRPIKTNV